MNIELKENEWAFIFDLSTHTATVKPIKWTFTEVTDKHFDGVLGALIHEVCYLAVGKWRKDQLLKLVGANWDGVKKLKELEQKQTDKEQGRR